MKHKQSSFLRTGMYLAILVVSVGLQTVSAYDSDSIDGVVLHTTGGDVTVNLLLEETPLLAAQFLSLASNGFYKGVPLYEINESVRVSDVAYESVAHSFDLGEDSPLSNTAGTLAAAQGSARMVFNLQDNSYLDDRQEVFGSIIAGAAILHSDVAVMDVSISKQYRNWLAEHFGGTD